MAVPFLHTFPRVKREVKYKALISSIATDIVHSLISEAGIKQVFISLKLLGGGVNRDFSIEILNYTNMGICWISEILKKSSPKQVLGISFPGDQQYSHGPGASF